MCLDYSTPAQFRNQVIGFPGGVVPASHDLGIHQGNPLRAWKPDSQELNKFDGFLSNPGKIGVNATPVLGQHAGKLIHGFIRHQP